MKIEHKVAIFALTKMVVVAQLVRALDCGSRGRRFEPDLPPKRNPRMDSFFLFSENTKNEEPRSN